jgi:hypothetical protein
MGDMCCVPRLAGHAERSEDLNAWCELSSPSQQVGEGQAGTAELLIEPHAEVMQRHPRCQQSLQSTQLVGPLPEVDPKMAVELG